MKKLEQLALDEIKKNADTINMDLYQAQTNITAIRDTLRHCELTKEGLDEILLTAHKAISSVESSVAASKLIKSWVEGLSEK